MKYITLKHIACIIGVSESTAYRLTKRLGFPPKLKIGGNARWVESEVKDWLNGCRVQS